MRNWLKLPVDRSIQDLWNLPVVMWASEQN